MNKQNDKKTTHHEEWQKLAHLFHVGFLIMNWTETIVRIINSLVVMILIHIQ